MEKISYGGLLEKAEQLKEMGKPWHHHFFTPDCIFNDADAFRIVLEDELDSKVFYTEFPKKPIKELKALEDLFFSQRP